MQRSRGFTSSLDNVHRSQLKQSDSFLLKYKTRMTNASSNRVKIKYIYIYTYVHALWYYKTYSSPIRIASTITDQSHRESIYDIFLTHHWLTSLSISFHRVVSHFSIQYFQRYFHPISQTGDLGSFRRISHHGFRSTFYDKPNETMEEGRKTRKRRNGRNGTICERKRKRR